MFHTDEVCNGVDDNCDGRTDEVCQPSCATWAGGPDPWTDRASDVAVLPDGRAIVVGVFDGSAVFGAGEVGEIALAALPPDENTDGEAAPSSDAFVARYGTDCKVEWAERLPGGGTIPLGGPSVRVSTYASVAVLPDGGFVVASWFAGTQPLGPSREGIGTITAVGEADAFFAKYEASGELAWVRQIRGAEDEVVGDLVALPDGGFVAVGTFEGTATFDSDGSPETLRSLGDSDVFIARYASTGHLLWVRRAGGPGGRAPFRLEQVATSAAALPDGGVIVGGYFEGTMTFEGDAARTLVAERTSGFVARFDEDGQVTWATRAFPFEANVVDKVPGQVIIHGVAAAADGSSVAATGAFFGSIELGEGEPREARFTERARVHSGFLAMFHPDGSLAWAVAPDGNDAFAGMACGIAADGSVTFAGGYRGSWTFDAGGPDETTFRSPGGGDVFVATYDATGAFRWARSTFVSSADPSCNAHGISNHADGSSWVVGAFSGGPITFFPDEGAEALLRGTDGIMGDAFIARYPPYPPIVE